MIGKTTKNGILEIHGTATKFGGASNGTKILFEEITKKGENIFLCYNLKNEVLNDSKVKNNRLALSFSTKNPLIFISNLFKLIIFILQNNIKVIHSHHRNDTIYACLTKIFIWKLKIFFTIHGPQVVKKPTKLVYSIIHKFFLFITEIMIFEVIYISKYTKDLTYSSFERIKRHKIIYNGTPTPNVIKDKTNIRNSIQVGVDDFVVSIIGGISGYKRPDLVIEIATLLKERLNIYFVFIGDGAEKEKIKNLSIKRNLKNIRFVNITPNIGDYINASNIIISTAIGEGFGRTLIEAMALQKPVIAFNNGGPKEIIINNHNGYLIEENNLIKYSESILKIYENKKLAIDFGINGINLFLSKFSEEIYSNNYLNEFKKQLQ